MIKGTSFAFINLLKLHLNWNRLAISLLVTERRRATVSNMKSIKDLSLRELDEAFRAATLAAKEEADTRGLTVVGLDKDGNLVSSQPEQTKNHKVA
jgi:hypothetical protein